MMTSRFPIDSPIVRWGILGSATITASAIAPAIHADPRARLVAVGSRGQERADATAGVIGAERAHGSYQGLLNDPDIDIVYNPLPNALHHEWTISALRAGKHVLCEKPMGLTGAEVQNMVEEANRSGRLLVEGFMWRYNPRVHRVHDLICNEIGRVRLIRADFTSASALMKPGLGGQVSPNIRYSRTLGGGALADLGTYCVNALRVFSSAPATDVSGSILAMHHGVDTRVAGQITFDNKIVGDFFSALDTPGGGTIEILGDRGRIRMPNAFRTSLDLGADIIEFSEANGTYRREVFPYVDQYQLQIEHISSVLLDGVEPHIPPKDSIENAMLLDRIRHSMAGA